MKKHLTVKIFMLVVLLAIAAVGASAQSQTTMGNATTAATLPAPADPLAAAVTPMFPTRATAAPAAMGANSNDQGYILVRAYVFTISRSNGDPAVIQADNSGNVSSVTKFNYGTEWAFKIQAGWNATNDFGFRASYFRTKQDANENRTGAATAPFFLSPRPLNVTFTGAADPGTPAAFSESFLLHVIDLEGTYKFLHSSTQTGLISVGVRIAPSRQNYRATDTFVGFPEIVTYEQRRTGVGPTAGVDFRQKLGPVWWFAGGRFSALWGSIRENAAYAAGGFAAGATRKAGRSNLVWEGEAGLEWNTPVGGGEFFLNGGFIIHDWQKLLNVTPTSPVGLPAFAALDDPAAAPLKGGIRFTGGSFSAGFRF